MKLNESAKKDSILLSAAKLFSENPFHKVTMNDIALNSDVAKGTLYYYFGSKEELYEHIITKKLEVALSDVKEVIGHDPEVDLRQFVKRSASFFHENRLLVSLLQRGDLAEREVLNRLFLSKLSDLKEQLAEIVRRGYSAGIFRKVDDMLVSELIFGAILSTIQKSNFLNASALINDIIMYGIRKGDNDGRRSKEENGDSSK